MKNYLFTLAFAFFSVLIISSCTDKEEFVFGEFDSVNVILTDTEDHYIRYQENEQEIKLIIEDLGNLSNNLEDAYPALDFLSIRVDVNNNKMGDVDIDKQYGISSVDRPCAQFYKGTNAFSGCFEELGYSYLEDFRSTEKLADQHVVYELIIRKESLSEEGRVGLVFIMNGTDGGGAFPSDLSLYGETVEIAW